MSPKSSATAQAGAVAHSRAVSRKRRLRRRIVIFSWFFGIATVAAGAIPFCLVDVYLPIGRLAESNSQTLQRASGRTFLRKYFLLTDSSAHSYADAIQLGEGLTIEFKRSISFDVPNSVDRVLETIAAFANTAGGTIFIGVEDNGKVHGLRLDGTKARDALNERIHQSVRNRVRPSPVIQTAFLEAEGQTVCRIFVPRGEQPLHGLDGVIYVRDRPSDIKAPPERIVKLVEEYAV